MDTLLKDIRFGARMLLRHRASTIIAVVALALGIGLTAVMFSIVWGAMLRGLPYEEQDELVVVRRIDLRQPDGWMNVSVHDFEDWRAQQQSFEDLAAYYSGTVNVTAGDTPDRFDGTFITPQAFTLVGAEPYRGRLFTEADARPEAERVMLLSYATWQERFGGGDVVGRVVRANAMPTTIIGIMPEGFAFPAGADVWLPHAQQAASLPRNGGIWLDVFGRLKDGVSMDQASAEMATIAQRLAAAYPETNEEIGTRLWSFVDGNLGEEPIALLLTMLGAVFMVLLIACVNVANLLIARASARAREVGVRTALGASGVRIVRQFLTESFILSLAGALVGLVIAWFGIRLFNNSIASVEIPFWIDIRLDGGVLLFVLAITVFASLVAGAIPAWQAAHANLGSVLKDESRGASSFRLGRISRALVVVEIALSAGLLVGAGLMIKSVTRVRTVPLPFATEDVFTARIGLPEAEYADTAAQRLFFTRLQQRLREMPGAAGVGLIQSLPGVGSSPERSFALDGVAYADDREYPTTNVIAMTPGLLDAVDVDVLRGRDLGDNDRLGAQPVVIVNESFVERTLGGADAIGRRIRFGTSDSTEPWHTIVGVVPDLYVNGFDNGTDNPQAAYVPLDQDAARFMTIVARARNGDPLTLTQPVRDAVLAVDADLPLYWVQSLRAAIDADNWFYMVFGTLFMIFGGAALFMAAVGLYGVMSTSVSQRTREMGVRMALGAETRDVLGLIMRQGLVQLAIGLVLGLGFAVALSNLLQTLLFDVNPRDPFIFFSIAIVLSATAAIACLIPAARATRVDPLEALRTE